jgi:NTE family protein
MWNPNGSEPESIWEVLHRQKDIQYSSRVASHIARQRQVHKLRHVVSELVKFIPEEKRSDPVVQDLAEYGCRTQMHVVQLLAPRLEDENHTKDIDFSHKGVAQRWEAGYSNTMRALHRRAWEDACDPLEGVILHDLENG